MDDVRVVYAENGRAGLAAIDRESPTVIVTDLIMPDMEGLELVQEVRALHPHISVVLMTAYGSEDVAIRALRAGAANYIAKKDSPTTSAPPRGRSSRCRPTPANAAGS